MAITAVKLGTSLHDDTDLASYTYPSATYTNGRLYVLFVHCSIATGPAPIASVTGGGITWVEIGAAGGVVYSGAPSSARRIQAFRGLVTSGATTGALTITMADAGSGATATSCHAVVVEVTGMDATGTNGSGAIVQSNTGTDGAANALTGTVSLSAFNNAANRPLAFFHHRAAEASTPEGGYSSLDDGTGAAPSSGTLVEWCSSSNEDSPSATWATTSNWGGFAVELKIADWTLEQAKHQQPSNVVAYANDVKTGSLLLACCSVDVSPPATPTDSRGNAWTLIEYANEAQEIAWWYAISKDAGACTVTLDPGSTFKGYIIAEFSTDLGAISFDTRSTYAYRATVGAGVDKFTTVALTVAQDNSLVVSLAGSDAGGISDLAAGTGCVLDAQGDLASAGGDRIALEHQIDVAAGSKTLPWTTTSNWDGPVLAAAFKAGAAPPEPTFRGSPRRGLASVA